MIDLWWISLAGAAGSFHCLGMCSGFALSLAPSRAARWRTVGRHLIYNSGRVVTYCFLGVAAGAVGGFVARQPAGDGAARAGARLRRPDDRHGAATASAGGCRSASPAGTGSPRCRAACAGCSRPPAPPPRSPSGSSTVCCPARWSTPSSPRRWLPAASARGLATMVAFGLGTFPAMLAVAFVGCTLKPALAAARGAGGGRGHPALRPGDRRSRRLPRLADADDGSRDGAGLSVAAAGELCSHCLVPAGRNAYRGQVAGERLPFCCFGCYLAFRAHGERGEEAVADAAAGPPRRRRLPGDEHHGAQPAPLHRSVGQRRPPAPPRHRDHPRGVSPHRRWRSSASPSPATPGAPLASGG